MSAVRSSLRILFFAGCVLIFLLISFVLHAVTRDRVLRRRRFSAHASWWCRQLCRAFNITVVVTGQPSPDQVGLVVGNHLGFIDILAGASVRPNLFVTSQEMRETPVLGLLTEMGGCIYVERRSRANIRNELGEITETLKRGLRVVLYPEAASTNGEGILPFKRTLLTAAANAGVPILPFVFNFREINGEPGFQMKYRDSVCWYGDMPFYTALWRACGLKSLVCEIEYLSPVYTKSDNDRAAVAEAVRQMILMKYRPVGAKKIETHSV